MKTSELLRASWRSWLARCDGIVGPAWWQYAWTFAFCVVVAAGFALLGFAFNADAPGEWDSLSKWWAWYRSNLIVTLSIGYAIHLLFDISARAFGVQRLRHWNRRARAAYFTIVPGLGVAIGWPLGMAWATGADLRHWFAPEEPDTLLGPATLSLLVWCVFWLFFSGKERQIRAEKRAAEAQLKLLQGQIEPHFLFNTLANVIGLMERDTPRAKAMLESFADYLRASFASLRHEGHTLGDELALVEAYLRVVGTRMDERLRWRIDVPEPLRHEPMLALTLQPLVENAVVHGLEPKIDGGALAVSARRHGDVLEIAVEDDGLGLRTPAACHGAGSALGNVRARLLQAFGSAASLDVDAAPIGGVRARLRLPCAQPG